MIFFNENNAAINFLARLHIRETATFWLHELIYDFNKLTRSIVSYLLQFGYKVLNRLVLSLYSFFSNPSCCCILTFYLYREIQSSVV